VQASLGWTAQAELHPAQGTTRASRPDALPEEVDPTGRLQQELRHSRPGGLQREVVERSEQHDRCYRYQAHQQASRGSNRHDGRCRRGSSQEDRSEQRGSLGSLQRPG